MLEPIHLSRVIDQVYDRNIFGYWGRFSLEEIEKARFIYTSLHICRKALHKMGVWSFLVFACVLLGGFYVYFHWPLSVLRQEMVFGFFLLGALVGLRKAFWNYQVWQVEKCFLVFALLLEEDCREVFEELLERDPNLKKEFVTVVSLKTTLGFS